MNRIVVRGSQCLGVLVLAVVVLQASAQPTPSLPEQRAADLAALDRFVRDSYGPRRPEFVDARGPWTYTAPVVVLVDRFSVSMAEGFAMALAGLGRARIVGTRTARLGAAVGRIELPYSKIAVQISTEPVYAIDGTPRWELEPDVVVNPLERADGNDPFIAAAIEELDARL